MIPVLRTRNEALGLLRAADWDPRLLSLEEWEAIRHLFFLDNDRTIAKRLQAHPLEWIALPRGARLIRPKERT